MMAEQPDPACWAVVPVKRLGAAKSRLAPALDAAARQALQAAMLRDVLEALGQVPELAGIVVVSIDGQAGRIARACGAAVLNDPARDSGMNAAVAAGLHEAAGRGAGMVAVIPADMPALVPAEVSQGIAATRARGAVHVVPDWHAEGTNALFLPGPWPPFMAAPAAATASGVTGAAAFAPTGSGGLPYGPVPVAADPGGAGTFGAHCFGPHSFARHLSMAWPGPAPVALALPSLAVDVDRPGDIARLIALAGAGRAEHTRRLCQRLGLGQTVLPGVEQRA